MVGLTNNWTVHNKPGDLERPTIRSGDDKLVGKSLEVTEIRLQDVLAGRGDNVVPLRQMNIPHWAIAALIGRPAKHIRFA